MEVDQRIPPKMNSRMLDAELEKIAQVIARLIDKTSSLLIAFAVGLFSSTKHQLIATEQSNTNCI